MNTGTTIAALAGAAALIAAPAVAQEHAHHAHAGAQASAHASGHGHQHAEFDSGRFHVRVDGPEAPIGDVILIPGLSSSPKVWDELTEALKGRYRVHRLHVQGFAGTPAKDNAQGGVSAGVAQDLSRYIREQHLEKPAVIGHSMGGTIAMMLAARHPDQVGRLMVVDSIPFMGSMFGGGQATAESVAPMADMMAQQMSAASDEQYHAQAARSVTGMIATESLRAGPLQDAATSDRAVVTATFRELVVTDLRPELARITAPTTVLYVKFNGAGMSNEMTDGIYKASYATLPGATLTRIDDSAHFIMLDQPVRFVAEVNAFLE